MQRALSLRDTSCKHPGCVNTHYLDAHHIKHWADGGETKLDNLVMLCRHHHQALHKGAFEISIVDDEVVFTSATGKHLHRSPHLPAASGFFHSESIRHTGRNRTEFPPRL